MPSSAVAAARSDLIAGARQLARRRPRRRRGRRDLRETVDRRSRRRCHPDRRRGSASVARSLSGARRGRHTSRSCQTRDAGELAERRPCRAPAPRSPARPARARRDATIAGLPASAQIVDDALEDGDGVARRRRRPRVDRARTGLTCGSLSPVASTAAAQPRRRRARPQRAAPRCADASPRIA